MELSTRKRVGVIVEKVYEDKVIKILEDAGACGFTAYKNIYGKGRRGMMESGLSDVAENIEIVSIIKAEVAERVLQGLQHAIIEKGIPLVVHIVEVQVMSERF